MRCYRDEWDLDGDFKRDRYVARRVVGFWNFSPPFRGTSALHLRWLQRCQEDRITWGCYQDSLIHENMTFHCSTSVILQQKLIMLFKNNWRAPPLIEFIHSWSMHFALTRYGLRSSSFHLSSNRLLFSELRMRSSRRPWKFFNIVSLMRQRLTFSRKIF